MRYWGVVSERVLWEIYIKERRMRSSHFHKHSLFFTDSLSLSLSLSSLSQLAGRRWRHRQVAGGNVGVLQQHPHLSISLVSLSPSLFPLSLSCVGGQRQAAGAAAIALLLLPLSRREEKSESFGFGF